MVPIVKIDSKTLRKAIQVSKVNVDKTYAIDRIWVASKKTTMLH